MKEYNRQTKRWEEKKEDVGSLKRPETCKGGRPHDFVLLVPKYIKTDHFLTADEVAEYYRLEEEDVIFQGEQRKKYKAIGIVNAGFRPGPCRFYRCSVCGKEEWDLSESKKK